LNNGAYFYTEPRLNRIAREIGLEDPDVYAHARRAIATTATGNGEHHAAETKALFNSLLRYK
jgi:2-oxoglutarate dehydrogenase complex, dehydrogenase (E1) component, and related enzymes